MVRRIDIEPVCRVEGHGGVTVEIEDGRVADVKMEVFEGPRLFEALLVGRRFDEVASIACRICAICSVSHTLTALLAIENALGVKVSRQTQLLRDLLCQGEMIESHYLHLYFLALPDFLGFTGAPTMAGVYPTEVKRGLWLKKLGNTIQETVGGRAIHPVTAVVGGFTKAPSLAQLRELRQQLVAALPEAVATVGLFAQLGYPDLPIDGAQFLALEPAGGGYGFFGTRAISNNGLRASVESYKEYFQEQVVPHSTAKQSRHQEAPFMVGALARVNLNGARLGGRASEALYRCGVTFPSYNTYHNNLAQAIEGVFSVERAIDIINELERLGIEEEEKPAPVEVRAGRGTAATEAPRGTLYHSYTLDEQGFVLEADVVTPTAQNLANIERDIRAAVEAIIKAPPETTTARLEMLVRAYDPCISCATHLVEVKFKQRPGRG